MRFFDAATALLKMTGTIDEWQLNTMLTKNTLCSIKQQIDLDLRWILLKQGCG